MKNLFPTTVRKNKLWRANHQHSKLYQGNNIELTRPLVKLRTDSCSDSFVRLEWAISDTSWVAAYRIRRTTISSRASSIFQNERAWFYISANSLTWTDHTVKQNSLYRYDIFIVDKGGALHPTGGSIIQSPTPNTFTYYERVTPPSIELLEVTERYANIQIYSRDATFVELYRSDQEFPYPIAHYRLNALSKKIQSLSDLDVVPGGTYSYCAIARNWHGTAASSAEDVDVIIPKKKIFQFRRFLARNKT